MCHRRLTSVLAGWLLLGSGSAGGQQPPVFSITSDLVVLQVTVKDARGGYVTGLPPTAFTVVEDGRPQTVRYLSSADTPVTVGLLIDSSASMLPLRSRVIAAAEAFVAESHPDDEVFALAFNEQVRSALPDDAPFTSEPGVLRGALEATIGARGRTALYDAIVSGIEYLAQGSRERKALVVVSDGDDNASRTTVEPMLRRAQASNAVIYTIALVDQSSRSGNPRLLREIAEASGGEAFRPRDGRGILEAFSRIAREIRHSYTLGYVSSNQQRDGRFRRVRVVVDPPDGRRVIVRTRSGYLAGSGG